LKMTVIAINDQGRPDFEALQARLRPRNGKLPWHLCHMVFDGHRGSARFSDRPPG